MVSDRGVFLTGLCGLGVRDQHDPSKRVIAVAHERRDDGLRQHLIGVHWIFVRTIAWPLAGMAPRPIQHQHTRGVQRCQLQLRVYFAALPVLAGNVGGTIDAGKPRQAMRVSVVASC